MFDDVFVRLVATLELTARSTLSRRLAREPRAPLAISHILASDDEIDVAGPMLEHSARLDNSLLVATIRGKSQRHLLAISRRKTLDEAVTDVLVERGNNVVVLSTVANPAASFSDGGYAALVRRSEGQDEIAASVALRHDIPRRHLMRLLMRASDAVRRKLETADPHMKDLIQDAVAEGAMTIMDGVDATSRYLAALHAQMEALRASGRLAEPQLAAFATAGQTEAAIAALSVLCDVPIEAVNRAMTHERPDAVLVLARAAELSTSTVAAILRMRADARGISPGELQQCLANYSQLKPDVARQIIKFRDRRAQSTRFTRPTAETVLARTSA